MAEKIVGIGYAVIDATIRLKKGNPVHLPDDPNKYLEFLRQNSEAKFSVGGTIPNVLSTIVGFTNSKDGVRLVGTVGRDRFGDEYVRIIDPRLGRIQRSDKPTGIYIALVNAAGETVEESKPFYRAAEDVIFPEEEIGEMHKLVLNGAVFSNLNVLREVKKATDSLKETGGLFALNLNVVSQTRTTRELLQHGLEEDLKIKPNIIMGNLQQARYVTGNSNANVIEAVDALYESMDSENRLVVVTNDVKGFRMRFGDDPQDVIDIPPFEVLIENFYPLGAGDTVMGIIVAGTPVDPALRTRRTMEILGRTGANAASKLVRIPETWLAPGEFVEIRNYERLLQATL